MIFLSYRRADTEQATGRIHERLADQYGAENIFRDLDTIASGERFLDAIKDALARSDVFLVLIGRRWADAQNGPRLFDPADVVRQEIEIGLGRELTTIPVLIDRAPFPTADQIPEALHSLLGLNAASIESGVDFDLGIRRLIDRIDAISAAAAERRTAVTLRDDAWQFLDQPLVEVVNALVRDRRDPARIYASALLAKRILRADADPTRWFSYVTLPPGQSLECLAVSAGQGRGILHVGTTGHLFQYHQADFQWRDTAYFAGLGEREVRCIAVNRSDPGHILIGTGKYWSGMTLRSATGVAGGGSSEALGESNWKPDVGYGDLHGTRDGGVSWKTGPFRNVNRVLFAETSPSFVYIATADDGLFVSTDGRASFNPSGGTGEYTLFSAAVSPHDPSHVILGTRWKGVLVSFDAGQSWSRPSAIEKASGVCAAFSPVDPAAVVVGTDDGVFLSNDGGRTFTASNRGLVHRRVVAALHLESGEILLGTDGGGIYARPASGGDWRQVHRGLMQTAIGAIAFDADDVLYAGAGGSLWKTEDLGRSFQPLHHAIEAIRSICVFGTPEDKPVVRWNRQDVLLAGTERGSIDRSGDYGGTWERVLENGGGSVRKIASSASRPGVVYAVAAGRALHVSEDAGHTWTGLKVPQAPVTFALAEDRSDGILIGTYQHGVMESDDRGVTWRAVGAGLPAAPVTSLALLSVDGTRHVLAGLQGGGLWRFSDDQNTWLAPPGAIAGESVNDILCRGAQILIATNSGIFSSTDGGASWANFSDGMSNVRQVTRLAVSSDGRTLFCGEARGLYARLI